MCTVTYLPIIETGKQVGFLLTSNRDEKTIRPAAIPPQRYIHDNQWLVYPKDPVGNGSWLATNGKNRTVCLLNGGFLPHVPSPPYRYSRGKVVLDVFSFSTLVNFKKEYDLSGIEPFTLVVVDQFQVYEFRWDGFTKYLETLDPTKPAIWSSVTLYSPLVIDMRKSWFQHWLHSKEVKNPLDFHRFQGSHNPAHNLLMEKDNVYKTVSISQVSSNGMGTSFFYTDLITGKEYLHPIAAHVLAEN